MKLRIDYDGDTYWVVGYWPSEGREQRLSGHTTYGEAEREYYATANRLDG